MCGRYYVGDPSFEKMLRIVEELNRRFPGAAVKTSGEAFPGDDLPALAGDLSPAVMRWGFLLPDGRRVINARSETMEDKPLFRNGVRCAIPAQHYFEWERSGREKTKYAIGPADGGLMYLAGLFRAEEQGAAFTVLTKAPEENIAFLHDRMPVLLPEALLRDWLNPRYRASEILREAAVDVCFAPAEDGPQQLRMEF